MVYKLNQSIKLKQILPLLGVKPQNQTEVDISYVAGIEQAIDGCLSFLNSPLKVPTVNNFVLIAKEIPPNFNGSFIQSNEPKLDFVKVLNWINEEIGFNLDTSSYIAKTAKIHSSAIIMEGVYIGENSEIGPKVVLMPRVKIGNDTKIGAGTIIGDEGFGYVRGADKSIHRFVHLGGVVIGNQVVIGNNCTVARGSLSNTIIEDSVKIDNLVHLAHGVHIGHRTMIAACAEISGSVKIGEDTWIGPGAVIINGIGIQSGTTVGLGSVVIKNIDSSGEKVFGNPARILPN